jgi:hypothetical protein
MKYEKLHAQISLQWRQDKNRLSRRDIPALKEGGMGAPTDAARATPLSLTVQSNRGGVRLRMAKIGNDVFAEQANRIHDVLVREAAELHEAQHLIDSRRLILFEDADAGVRVAHAKHATFD